jgi:hypothetical protein
MIENVAPVRSRGGVGLMSCGALGLGNGSTPLLIAFATGGDTGVALYCVRVAGVELAVGEMGETPAVMVTSLVQGTLWLNDRTGCGGVF